VAIDATDPIAIEALPDGSVLILDRLPVHGARLLRDGIAGRFGAATPLEPFTLNAYDLVFVPADARAMSVSGRLYVATAEGNQAAVFDLDTVESGALAFTLTAEYLPMRLFGGKGLIS